MGHTRPASLLLVEHHCFVLFFWGEGVLSSIALMALCQADGAKYGVRGPGPGSGPAQANYRGVKREGEISEPTSDRGQAKHESVGQAELQVRRLRHRGHGQGRTSGDQGNGSSRFRGEHLQLGGAIRKLPLSGFDRMTPERTDPYCLGPSRAPWSWSCQFPRVWFSAK